jgi:rubrerythrin
MTEINKVWHNIMRDEKEHYGMFLTLVRKYDPGQYQEYLRFKDIQINVTPVQTYKGEYDKQIILNNVRSDIKGELEAVILYEQINGEMPYQDIRDTFNKIILDEKEHTEMLTSVLLEYESSNINSNI